MKMAGGTLYTYPDNWRAYKPLIAAQYSGLPIKVASTPPEFQFGVTNKTPEFLKKFPLGKVPAFEDIDGFCLFESSAIAHYVGNDELRGTSRLHQAHIIQWVSFAESHIVPPASAWVFPTLGIMQFNKQATEQAKEEVKHVLETLDTHLQTRTFLVGERITLADINVVCSLLWLYKQVLDPSFRQPYGNVTRWFVTCVNQPQFRAVLGEVKLCDKMAQFDAKKFAELQPKKETPKKEKPSKEPKKEKEEKKPPPAPAPEEEMDEADQALAAEPKSKDPYTHLPKSAFVMDEFKRKYSNEDTLTVALPHFWDHFDKEGWSIWYAEYRFPGELTQTFMSCNLITGKEAPFLACYVNKRLCYSWLPIHLKWKLSKFRQSNFTKSKTFHAFKVSKECMHTPSVCTLDRFDLCENYMDWHEIEKLSPTSIPMCHLGKCLLDGNQPFH
uniref:Elongation factor-1 gamma n=1 Tax=Leptobrachium leishanense TaxID=445787 RepID=A0A8C5QX28_9ANUR